MKITKSKRGLNSFTDLAEKLGITVRKLMKILESKGYIRRDDNRQPVPCDEYREYFGCNDYGGSLGLALRVTDDGVLYFINELQDYAVNAQDPMIEPCEYQSKAPSIFDMTRTQ